MEQTRLNLPFQTVRGLKKHTKKNSNLFFFGLEMFSRKAKYGEEDEAPAPPPITSAQRIPAAQFLGQANRTNTRRQVDMLVMSKDYNNYNKYRIRFENLTYLTAFGLLGLFGFAYADFIAMIASGKVPSAESLGTLLLVIPYWLAVTLSWVAALVVYPCAFMTPWSSLFFEIDDWSDVKGVLFFQGIAITLSSLIPYYHFGTVHQPAKNGAQFVWNFAALSAPTFVGFIYYKWRSQNWQRALGFTAIPLWAVPCIFGLASLTLWDFLHNGKQSCLMSPALLLPRVVSPSIAELRHMWAFFQLHSWTALISSYLWYLLPKFV